MHAVFAAYTLSGLYPLDIHTRVIDLLAVPAAVYFVWVVQALYRGTFRDWNRAGRVVRPGPLLRPDSHAPDPQDERGPGSAGGYRARLGIFL